MVNEMISLRVIQGIYLIFKTVNIFEQVTINGLRDWLLTIIVRFLLYFKTIIQVHWAFRRGERSARYCRKSMVTW